MHTFRLTPRTYRFVLAILFILTLATLSIPMKQEYDVRKAVILEKTKVALATTIQNQTSHLKAFDFNTTDRAYQDQVFSKLFTQIQSLDFVRIKVWNPDYVVVWSDLKDTIGQQFTDNHEVEEALEGEIELEIAVEKSEHVTERQFSSFAEVYVPVRAKDGTVIGVLEVYSSAASLEKELRMLQIQILLISLLGSVLVSLTAAYLLRKFIR